MEGKRVRRRKKKKLTIDQIKRGSGAPVRSVISRMKAREVELTVVCVFLILVVILVGSYFVFSSVRKVKTYDTLKTGNLEVVFNENDKNLGDIISFTKVKPLSDKAGLKTIPYQFKIVNNGKTKSRYVVKIKKDNDMIDIDNCSDKLIDSEAIKYSIDDGKMLSLKDMKNSYQIYSEELDSKEKVEHSIRIWVSKDVLEDASNKHFHAKIVVSAVDKGKD